MRGARSALEDVKALGLYAVDTQVYSADLFFRSAAFPTKFSI
jgi:hypothetical protein